jgi:hypothetical protein
LVIYFIFLHKFICGGVLGNLGIELLDLNSSAPPAESIVMTQTSVAGPVLPPSQFSHLPADVYRQSSSSERPGKKHSNKRAWKQLAKRTNAIRNPPLPEDTRFFKKGELLLDPTHDEDAEDAMAIHGIIPYDELPKDV